MNASKTRRRSTQEFKDDAVSLVVEQSYSYSEVGRRLGVSENNIKREKNESASPHGLTLEQLEAELKRLRKESKRLEMEREILKKDPAQSMLESRMRSIFKQTRQLRLP